MRTIAINQSHCLDTTQNNTYVYPFPQSITFKDNAKIAVSSVALFYSTYNISTLLGNNKYTYTWTEGATSTTHTITIPDGIFNISQINAHLQYTLIANSHYLRDQNGSNVYYIQIVLNPSKYSVDLTTYEVPNALPTGFSNPASLNLPNSAFTPVVNLTTSISDILGFTSGFQTSTATTYSSSKSPQVNPNSNILVAIDAIENPYANPSSIAYSFPINVGAGEQLHSQPSELNFGNIRSGVYSQLRVTFLDTTLKPIQIRDPQVSIILVIKDDSSH